MLWERRQFSVGDWAAYVLLAFLWAAGSSMDVEKYAATAAAPILITGLLLLSCLVYLIAALPRPVPQPPKYVLAVIWLAVACAFAIIHPLSAQHTLTKGNDSEDALARGATNLLHLHYPYYSRTYLNNPITPMPGALILDSPFAALGHAGWQNLFWLAIFILFLLQFFRLRSTAVICLLLVLANAHTFVNLMTGADYPVNCLYICVAVFWFLRESRSSAVSWQYWGSALFLGLALSSRLSYLLIIPILVSSYLLKTLGVRPGIARLLAAFLPTAAVTLPFYLFDRKHFSPLHVANFLSAMTPAHQHVIFAVLTGGAILICLSAFVQKLTVDRVYLLAALAAAVILVPPGLIVALHQKFSVEGVLVLGYTDTAYIFLALWLCYSLEKKGLGVQNLVAGRQEQLK